MELGWIARVGLLLNTGNPVYTASSTKKENAYETHHILYKSLQESRATSFKVSLFWLIDYVGLVIRLEHELRLCTLGDYKVHGRKLIPN